MDGGPYIPEWGNLKRFLMGLLWVFLGCLGPAAYELWDAENYEHVDWRHIKVETTLVAIPMMKTYWRKHRALISPPADTDVE